MRRKHKAGAKKLICIKGFCASKNIQKRTVGNFVFQRAETTDTFKAHLS